MEVASSSRCGPEYGEQNKTEQVGCQTEFDDSVILTIMAPVTAGWSSGSSLGSIAPINIMNTKGKGDIAEQAVIFHALRRGWGVSRPIGDRLPYDLVFDDQGVLVKIQVKCAWFDANRQNWVTDNRRTKTNRRFRLRDRYKVQDFDFAVVYLPDLDVYYVFPVHVFIRYASEIQMVEADKRQRKPESANYRDAWELIVQWAACRETDM